MHTNFAARSPASLFNSFLFRVLFMRARDVIYFDMNAGPCNENSWDLFRGRGSDGGNEREKREPLEV